MGNRKNPWLTKQKSDPYYKKSKAEHHRARSYYKLKEIDAKYHILSINGRFPKKIIDLGAAPGAWLEYIKDQYISRFGTSFSNKFKVVGVDLTSIRPFSENKNIITVRLDVFKEECEDLLKQLAPWDVILSDLAPKTAGDFRDIAIQEAMVQKVLFFSRYLKIGGNLVVKVFQSEKTNIIFKEWAPYFHLFKRMKPAASRPKSRELYLIGKGYKGK
ncbi:SAM-dependent methyltransferase [Candidatus Harpocratesius sp.]